jgi:uracil-DNA glycosylase family 4
MNMTDFNPNASIFLILDNPGAREDKEGNSFVCGTRETLQSGMREAGIPIDAVYVSYLLKCRPIRTYNKPLARATCSPYLHLQLDEKRPQVLLGLGNVVAQAMFPESEVDVKGLRGQWHMFQDIQVTFTYHPLAVRRRPVLMKYLVDDLRFVAERVGRMV